MTVEMTVAEFETLKEINYSTWKMMEIEIKTLTNIGPKIAKQYLESILWHHGRIDWDIIIAWGDWALNDGDIPEEIRGDRDIQTWILREMTLKRGRLILNHAIRRGASFISCPF